MAEEQDVLPAEAQDADAAFDQAFTEAVQPPEAPASDDTAPAKDAAQPEPSDAAQPRDEQGRFTKAPQPDEPKEESAVPPSSEAEQVPETPDEPTDESATTEAPEYVFRADGQEQKVFPGSAVGEDGAFFPKDQLPRLNQLLAAGVAHQGSFRQRLSESAQREQTARSEADALKVQLQEVLGRIEQMVETNTIGEWLENVHQNWPVLKAEAKAKGVELQSAADKQRLRSLEQQAEMARMRPLMEDALHRAVEGFGQDASLSPAVRRQLLSRLQTPAWESRVFVRAPMDDPSQGIRQGDLVIDYSVVRDEVQFAAQFAPRPAAPTPAPKPKVAQKPPPNVPAKRGPAPPAKRTPVKTFKSAEEADEFLVSGNLDELIPD